MERASPDDVAADRLGDGVVRHRLSGPLGAAGVAMNRYRVPPGAGLPGGLHAHADQEEVFVVLAGEATFDVLAPTADEGANADAGGRREGGARGRDGGNRSRDGEARSRDGGNRSRVGENRSRDGGARRREGGARTVTVGTGESVRFAPGEFQTGRNAGDRDLVVLALGAPRDSEDVRLPVECPDCGRGDVRLDAGDDGVAFVCPDCGASRVPLPCPDCGGDNLEVVPGERTRTDVVCRDCGRRMDEPPLSG